MALAGWPAGVPSAPLVEYWGVKPFRDPLSTDMEGGDERLRPRPGDAVATLRWGRRLLPAQAAALDTFLRVTLRNGAARFTMPVTLVPGVTETRVVQMVAGSLDVSAVSADRSLVTFQLRVFPATVTT